jgi:hypothetical protein
MQCGYFVAELVYKIIYSHPQWCLELQKNQNISIYCIQFFPSLELERASFNLLESNYAISVPIIVQLLKL